MLAAPQLARLAASFTSYEYFWLYGLGLTCAAVVSDTSRWKGAFALLLGLLFSTVGLGTDYSVPRLTFGLDSLITGINFIPAMIGLFGVSEVLRNALFDRRRDDDSRFSPGTSTAGKRNRSRPFCYRCFVLPPDDRAIWSASSTIGSLVGMLPGAGADIAAWISYAVSKRFSRQPRSTDTARRRDWPTQPARTTRPSEAPGFRLWSSGSLVTASPRSRSGVR